MTRFCLLLFFLFPLDLPAQDIHYASQIVDSLTSPRMEGRGYVNDGDKKAALFIAEEFRKHHADSFNAGYFQPFGFPVNTFPGKMKVSINNMKLQPGADYIVDCASHSGKGSYRIMEVLTGPSGEMPEQVKHKFILIDKTNAASKNAVDSILQWKECWGLAGIILIEEKKLTWSVSETSLHMPVIHILKKSLPAGAEKIKIEIDAWLNPNHQTQNIIGWYKGATEPDSFIVLSAHYDHLGRMGKETYFPGANDNASGTAMLLNFMQYYSLPENRPGCSLAFISFAGEEAGLIGSEYYTTHPLFPLSKIKFLINMDLLGTGDDGMMVVNGDVYKHAFEVLERINTDSLYVKMLGKRGKAHNSDHYYFSEKGVPCFFFYTLGGISAYHDIYDTGATLPFTDFEDVFRLTRDFINEIAR
jgi:aminopeptidase YwaD